MQTRQIYATGSATAESAANIQVPGAGAILGVQLSVNFTSITAGVTLQFELSMVNSSQVGTNDARDVVATLRAASNFVTSGLAQGGENVFYPVLIPVRAGDRIYLHASQGGTATWFFNGLIWFR